MSGVRRCYLRARRSSYSKGRQGSTSRLKEALNFILISGTQFALCLSSTSIYLRILISPSYLWGSNARRRATASHSWTWRRKFDQTVGGCFQRTLWVLQLDSRPIQLHSFFSPSKKRPIIRIHEMWQSPTTALRGHPPCLAFTRYLYFYI